MSRGGESPVGSQFVPSILTLFPSLSNFPHLLFSADSAICSAAGSQVGDILFVWPNITFKVSKDFTGDINRSCGKQHPENIVERNQMEETAKNTKRSVRTFSVRRDTTSINEQVLPYRK